MDREELERKHAANTVWAEDGSDAILVKYAGAVEVWVVIVEMPDAELGILEGLYGVFDNEAGAREFLAEVTTRDG